MERDETIGEVLARLQREVDALPFPVGWLARRRLQRLNRTLDERRNAALRTWWNDPR